MSFRKPGSDSSTTDFWVPTQTYSRASGVTSISSLFSSFLSGFFPPPLLLAEFVMLFSGRSFLSRLRWLAGFPRSPALPPELLLAHYFEQEDGATRPLRACANLNRLCWIFYCLKWELRERLCVCMSSLKLITSKPELCQPRPQEEMLPFYVSAHARASNVVYRVTVVKGFII